MQHKLLAKKIAVLDIETPYITGDGIGAIDRIYCIAVVMIDKGVVGPAKLFTEYWTPYTDGSLMEAIALVNTADAMSFHNGIGFDLPVIRNVLQAELTPTPLDTLILSKIIFSKDELYEIDAKLDLPKELWGSYSLKAFGYRLGEEKIEFDEFDEGLTEQLATYCKQDTVVSADLTLFLLDRENYPIDAVVDIEHKAAAIIALQTDVGFYMDIAKARVLNTVLLKEKHELSRELLEIFSPKWLKDSPIKEYKKLSTIRKFIPTNQYVDPWKRMNNE